MIEKNITPDSKVIKGIIDDTRRKLKEDGELMPVFFLAKDDRLAIIGAPFSNQQEKEMALMAIKQSAHAMEADWVFGVNEAWAVQMDTKEEYQKMKGRVSEHPNRVEVVMFNLQVRGGGTWMGSVEQTLHSDGSKDFGEVKMEEVKPGQHEGLFSDLLGQKPEGLEGIQRFAG